MRSFGIWKRGKQKMLMDISRIGGGMKKTGYDCVL